MDKTSFSVVYDSFLSKITDDMYLVLTKQDTNKILQELLVSAIYKFEFPRISLQYKITSADADDADPSGGFFIYNLNSQEINIISTYMIVQWLGQQIASIQNIRLKYSGSDFKFTSQANHLQKILQLKKDYEREGFHLQRLYKRRLADKDGIPRSTFDSIMQLSFKD